MGFPCNRSAGVGLIGDLGRSSRLVRGDWMVLRPVFAALQSTACSPEQIFLKR
jgi:hypothetical protein